MTSKPNNNLISDRRLGNAKRGALGKGLGALIPSKVASERNFFECPIARIKPSPTQPRRTFDEGSLEELAESIRCSGIIQPLVVRQDGADYRLIAGERRFRASKKLGLTVVPVVIKDVSPDEAFELALVENIQREDLNPVEEAVEVELDQVLVRVAEKDRVALLLGDVFDATCDVAFVKPQAHNVRASGLYTRSGFSLHQTDLTYAKALEQR